jgi:hypothetical protein
MMAAFLSVLPMPGLTSQIEVPGPDDLVIHFRSYDYGRRRLKDQIKLTRMGLDRIPSAPFSFFKYITDEHRSEHPLGIVWLVLEQKAQLHPIVKRLVNEVGATLFHGCLQATDSALCDFRFMTAASTLVLSPSTFSWWAAYLGSSKVHFPVLPGPIGRFGLGYYGPSLPWCSLVNNDPRWEYHLVFESDPKSWKRLRGTIEGAAEVSSQCAEELHKWGGRDDLSDMHTMLGMPPPAVKSKIEPPHGHGSGHDHGRVGKVHNELSWAHTVKKAHKISNPGMRGVAAKVKTSKRKAEKRNDLQRADATKGYHLG